MTETTGNESTVAIRLPPDEQVRTVLGDSYDPDQTLNVVKMFAGTADLAPPIASLVRAIFAAEGVDPKAREIITLRTAKNLNCRYEWQANTTLARNVGLSAEEVAAVGADGPVTGIASEYVLLCTATDELSSKEHTLSDQILRQMLERYDDTTCRKLVLMMSWFNMLSLFLNACRVPLETTDKVGGKTSPL